MFPALPRLSNWRALLNQTHQVIEECAPSPAPLIRSVERSLPFLLKQLAAETPLNRKFAGCWPSG